MVEVVALCKGCLVEVFQTELQLTSAEKKDGEIDPDRPKGGDGFMWDSIEETHARREVPMVKEFQRLSLFAN